MKLKNVLLSVMSLALVAVVAIGGTLAYLTDRDSEANVFTVGDVEIELNEDFKQGAELIPGVKVEKEARITNTGDNDAWVWMTMAIPAALDDAQADTGMGNPLHWNVPGVVWKGYGDTSWATAAKVQTALDNGYITADHIGENGLVKPECLWTICQENTDPVAIKQETIDGVVYNVYTFLYNGQLAAGDTTPVALHQVYLDTSIDINTDGQWYSVKNGEATKIDWNSNTNGNPIVYVSAYAMQTNEFDTVLDAYNAYNKQWGNNGTEYAEPVTVVSTMTDLEAALTEGGEIILTSDIAIPEGEQILVPAGSTATLDLNGHTITSPSKGYGIRNEGNVTITNGTIEGQFGAIGNYNNAVCVVENATLISKGYPASSSHAIYTSGNSSLTLTNVTVNHEGAGADGSVLYAAGNSTVVINSGNFTWSGSAYTLAAAGTSTVTINGGTFQNDNFFNWGGTITDNRTND